MHALPLRLAPQQDLRAALEAVLAAHGATAGFVLQAIGSLSVARIRFAGMAHATELRGDLEILTLAGTLSPDGVHLHISVSDAHGAVTGGHVEAGCVVRTTAEILVALLPGQRFSRVHDPASGYKELRVDPV
ncbi:MAG: PPC domain-containing DNA-binding protein [Pseudomonadota bacterium]